MTVKVITMMRVAGGQSEPPGSAERHREGGRQGDDATHAGPGQHDDLGQAKGRLRAREDPLPGGDAKDPERRAPR